MSTAQHDLRDRIEDRVNQGLLGQWYIAAKSVQVKANAPFGTMLLGRPVVLWRDAAGKAHALEDFCPHRGAKLSRGEVHEGNISCRYHGLTLDGQGTILRVPAMPDCPLEGRRAVQVYAVREAMDAVFVYVPSAARPTAPELPLPPELTTGEWTGFLCTAHWDTNYRYALDNLADPMHGCYLHANSFTLAYGAKQDLMKLNKTGEGFIVSRMSQTGENFDWTDMVVRDEVTYCRLDIPYPPGGGPGGPFRIMGFVTPVDERSCRVYFWRLRKVDGLARDAWRFMYRAVYEPRHWNVLEQDREMLEDMPDDARKREMLYQHDVGVSRIRTMLKQAARDQLEAEAALAEQASVGQQAAE
jgi:phenylpropionate dioxygenase-like ring-hydroxylating dioxygenase large terminal subunit